LPIEISIRILNEISIRNAMSEICNLQDNKKRCPCTYEPCDKKGKCCECLRYHLSRKELPACCFPKDVEKTYDRSFKKFIEVYSKELF